MRLHAQVVGGFFAAPPQAIAHVLGGGRVKRPRPSLLDKGKTPAFSMLDPCAGEGAAVRQAADLIGCPLDHVYAVEIEPERASACITESELVNVVGDCSFFGLGVTRECFSFIWLNPPFDDQGDGTGRVEKQFLNAATPLLVENGVMALICPEKILDRYGGVQETLLGWFDNLSVVPFPPEHRPYNEVVVFGTKRRHANTGYRRWGSYSVDMTGNTNYELPASRGPRTFEKAMPTEDKIAALFQASPLRRLMEPPDDPPPQSPPLELGKGHLALLLASGHVDGIVHHPGEHPHVVRGTAVKESIQTGETEDSSETQTKHTVIYTERISLVVRVLTHDGRLVTLQQNPKVSA